MSDAPAWTALGLSVVNSGVLVGNGWRTRRHRRAAGPSREIRAVLEAVREESQTVIALGYADIAWFLDDVRRTLDQRLDDLAKRTDDARLRGLLKDIAASWRRGFGHAPAPSPGVYVLDNAERAEFRAEVEDFERNGRVVDAIREALSGVEAALERVNELERRL